MLAEAGKPLRIDLPYWRARYGQNFPDLLATDKDDFLKVCIDDVYSIFYGVSDLWSHLERTVYEDKTRLCYSLLVSWYITDMFPDYSVGVVSMGGIPIKEKKIGGVTIKFSEANKSAGAVNNADLLQSLKSNAFGAKAYTMIKTSGKINLYLSR